MVAKINWKPSDKEIRTFGLTILIGFGVIAGIFLLRGSAKAAVWIFSCAAGVALLSWTVPPAAKIFYFVWMGFGFVIGSIVSRIVLALIFFAVITPVALFFKLIGRDALFVKKKSFRADSYWQEHPKIEDKSYYEHLS